jgi:hypothetical protein
MRAQKQGNHFFRQWQDDAVSVETARATAARARTGGAMTELAMSAAQRERYVKGDIVRMGEDESQIFGDLSLLEIGVWRCVDAYGSWEECGYEDGMCDEACGHCFNPTLWNHRSALGDGSRSVRRVGDRRISWRAWGEQGECCADPLDILEGGVIVASLQRRCCCGRGRAFLRA